MTRAALVAWGVVTVVTSARAQSPTLADGHAATLERERPTLAEATRRIVVRATLGDATSAVLDLVPSGGVPLQVALRDDGVAPDESPRDGQFAALAPLGQRPARVVLAVDGTIHEAGPVAWPEGEERRVLALSLTEGTLVAEATIGLGSKMRGDGTGVHGPELQEDDAGSGAGVPAGGAPIPDDAAIAHHAGWVPLVWAGIVTLWCMGLGLTWALRRR